MCVFISALKWHRQAQDTERSAPPRPTTEGRAPRSSRGPGERRRERSPKARTIRHTHQQMPISWLSEVNGEMKTQSCSRGGFWWFDGQTAQCASAEAAQSSPAHASGSAGDKQRVWGGGHAGTGALRLQNCPQSPPGTACGAAEPPHPLSLGRSLFPR